MPDEFVFEPEGNPVYNAVVSELEIFTDIEFPLQAQWWLYGLGGPLIVVVFVIFVKWILPRLTRWVGVEAEVS